ncbi:hypothetical protein Asi03nite_30140 [Actinoplanes siamensis]|uniref:histidine kinase n=1 Tax=Actinoplanes siamensis TaxID=1223317 RepID=A0A919N6Z9_9ACTN|nr:hypothetical protein Asi03nite_30140 [Actinoplanes siamensis]
MVLRDPARLAAVNRARRALPAQPIPLDAISRLAARLLHGPMAAATLVGADEEFFAGNHGLPESLTARGRAPLEYSVCKYVVARDHPVMCVDMPHDEDRELREHALVREYGVRAFLAVPVRDADDRSLGSLSVLDTEAREWSGDDLANLLDVAELLRPVATTGAAQAAERDRSFLDALLNSLSVGVLACDDTGRVTAVNQALREVSGIPADAPVPVDYAETVAGVLHDAQQRPMPWQDTPLMRALRGEHVGSIDILAVEPGVRTRTFATTAQPMTAPDGRVLGAVAVSDEVTAIRRAERFRACHVAVDEALRAARSEVEAAPAVLRAVGAALDWQYAELFFVDEGTGRLSSAGYWDASGQETEGLFGVTPVRGAGVTGRVWASGRAEWVPDVTAGPDRTAAYERRGIRTVLSVPVRNGEALLGVLTCGAGALEVNEELLTVLLDGVAAQLGVYVALHRAEQVTRQLSRAQDDFITLVGHEMRTPLTSIAANVTILAEDVDAMDAEQRQILRSVARNTGALQSIVDKLLDLAGLESGYLGLTLEQVDLAAIAAEAVGAARRLAAGSGVQLLSDLPERLPLWGDAVRLRQVVDDLLSNAVRYSRVGGRVRVELHAYEKLVSLCIADTGIGTPAEERNRVFDRFFRGSNVRHQGTTGSGLGLSVARTIASLHGGSIRLIPNRPSGTVACLQLPPDGVNRD